MTDLSILKILALIGIIGCLARIGFILFRVRIWKQLLLPSLIAFQLLLFVFDIISGETTLLVIVFVELLILGFGFFIIVKEIKRSSDLKTTVSGIFNQFLPESVGKWVMLELTLFSNAFYGISKALRIPKKEGWTYWKNSSFPAIFVLLIFVAPIEIFVVHYLLNINSLLINGILIFFYISSFLYIYGFWVSIKLHPHLISDNEVFLYRGCLSKTSFPINLVKSSTVVNGTSTKKEDSIDLTIPGGQVVEIVFSSQVKVENLFGNERITERVFVSFDEPQKFCNQINSVLTVNKAIL